MGLTGKRERQHRRTQNEQLLEVHRASLGSSRVEVSPAVLLIGDVLHPVDGLAVALLLNGDMTHPRAGRGPVPVLLAGWKPDHVTRPDFLDWPALALRPSNARGDDQRLAERVRVPRRPCARLEGDQGHRDTGRIRGLKERINTDRAGEPLCRTFAGRL